MIWLNISACSKIPQKSRGFLLEILAQAHPMDARQNLLKRHKFRAEQSSWKSLKQLISMLQCNEAIAFAPATRQL